MTSSEMALPSDRKFGLFFFGVFVLAGLYFHHQSNVWPAYIFASLASLFLLLVWVRAQMLRPLNRAWMRLGYLLGLVVSPLVLGIIFFGLFTPMGLAMRAFGRDELRLRFKKKKTHWIARSVSPAASDSFKNQF